MIWLQFSEVEIRRIKDLGRSTCNEIGEVLRINGLAFYTKDPMLEIPMPKPANKYPD